LVGWLLGWIVAIAAAITAVVVGGTVACLVLAMAWVWYRPCVGITLLVAVAGGISLIFLIPYWAQKGKDDGKSDI